MSGYEKSRFLVITLGECVCVWGIPSPVRVGTLLMGVPGTPIGAFYSNLNRNLLGRIVRTQPNMNFSTTYYRPGGIHL